MKILRSHRLRLLATLAATVPMLSVRPASAETRLTQTQVIDHVPGEDLFGNNRYLAIIPGLNQLYVGGSGSTGRLKLIDTATNFVVADPASGGLTSQTGEVPKIAVNATAGCYYEMSTLGKAIAINDAATKKRLSTISLSSYLTGADALQGFAVNTTTNTLYVTLGSSYNASGLTGKVLVINGATGTVTATVAVNAYPYAIVVDETLNRIFVQTQDPNSATTNTSVVNVIDGNTLAVGAITLSTNVRAGDALAVNPQTHRVYAGAKRKVADNSFVTEVAVLDGVAQTFVADIDFGPYSGPYPTDTINTLAVEPTTNRVFVGGQFTANGKASVRVIDGAANTVVGSVFISRDEFGDIDFYVTALAADPDKKRVYALSGSQVNVIDTTSLTRLPDVIIPLDDNIGNDASGSTRVQQKSAVDPGLNRLFVVNESTASLTVIDVAAGRTIKNIPLKTLNGNSSLGCVGVNPTTHAVYVSTRLSNLVYVIDGVSATVTTTISVLDEPRELAVDPTRNFVYVSTTGGLAVIDGATNTGVGLITNVIPRTYQAGDNYSAGNHTAVAVNPVTNRIYVTGYRLYSDYYTYQLGLDVIDGASRKVVSQLRPAPAGVGFVTGTLGINTATNKIYLISSVGTSTNSHVGLYEIDGVTGAVATAVPPPNSYSGVYQEFYNGALAVDPQLNRVYISYYQQDNFTGTLYFDANARTFTTFAGGFNTPVLTFDESHSRLFLTTDRLTHGTTQVYENVAVVQAPVLTSATTATGTVGQPFSFQLAATNSPTSYAASGLPQGLSLNAATGLISGTPTVQGSATVSVSATNTGGTGSGTLVITINAASAASHHPFFTGEVPLSNSVYYLSLPNGNPFGYYAYLSDQHYIYHFDLGYEYVFDNTDAKSGVYFYDFKSSGFFYTSPTFPFPYLYDFSLNTVLYYYPDPNNPGRYNTNGVRYFYNYATGKIITK